MIAERAGVGGALFPGLLSWSLSLLGLQDLLH